MKRVLATTILVLPLLVFAQPAGGGFGGMKPPGGPGGPGAFGEDPSAMMEREKVEIEKVCEKALQGADSINPAVEAFLALADEEYSLPAVSGSWAEIRESLGSADEDSLKLAAFEKYDVYLKELGEKADALDSLWDDETTAGLEQYSDSSLILKMAVDAGVESSREALEKLEEFIARHQEMLDNMSSMDASRLPPGGSFTKEMIYSMARPIREMSEAAERTREEIRIGEMICQRISQIVQ